MDLDKQRAAHLTGFKRVRELRAQAAAEAARIAGAMAATARALPTREVEVVELESPSPKRARVAEATSSVNVAFPGAAPAMYLDLFGESSWDPEDAVISPPGATNGETVLASPTPHLAGLTTGVSPAPVVQEPLVGRPDAPLFDLGALEFSSGGDMIDLTAGKTTGDWFGGDAIDTRLRLEAVCAPVMTGVTFAGTGLEGAPMEDAAVSVAAAGDEGEVAEDRGPFAEGLVAPSRAGHEQEGASSVPPPTGPLGGGCDPLKTVNPFTPHEVVHFRHLMTNFLMSEVTEQWPLAVYRESLREFKNRVRALEEEGRKRDLKIAELERTAKEGHIFAGNKYSELSGVMDILGNYELPRRVKALEDFRELIDVKYQSVHPATARELRHSGFEDCLKAIISRGAFDLRLLEDPSFMSLVRDQTSMHRAINHHEAQKRKEQNARRWSERSVLRSGGALPPGRVLPAHGGRPARGRTFDARRAAERMATEREAAVVRMAEEEEASKRPGATGAAPSTAGPREGVVHDSGASEIPPRATAAQKGKGVAEASNPAVEAEGKVSRKRLARKNAQPLRS